MQRSNQNYIVAHLQNGKIENSSGTNEKIKKKLVATFELISSEVQWSPCRRAEHIR